MSRDRKHAPQGTLPRRATDRVEDLVAWLLVLVGLVGTIVTLMLASDVYSGQMERARREAAAHTPVTAVLVRDASTAVAAGRAGDSVPDEIPVCWTGRDGLEHTGTTSVTSPTKAGQTVTVWVDHAQRQVPAPPTRADAITGAAIVAVLGWSTLAAALVLAWRAVRRTTLTYNCAGWEREWWEVEPRWSGRARGESIS
ncbi:hypothetical protein GCM10023321_47960 [Pseudonocardia eucalypti]|uniref:Integral membrane protein n=1 Tax=Pseudonocardia eucalypti TaxID=648755 RepID=A0ABP9QIC5_9PSEU|nr:hypothetical protein [Pseudonocardia eucalypti]